jgi:hypothetical protein
VSVGLKLDIGLTRSVAFLVPKNKLRVTSHNNSYISIGSVLTNDRQSSVQMGISSFHWEIFQPITMMSNGVYSDIDDPVPGNRREIITVRGQSFVSRLPKY